MTKGQTESYDWRSDLAFLVASVPVLANVNAPANRLLEHFDRLERKAADAVGTVERVKDAVGKSQTRKRVIELVGDVADIHTVTIVTDATEAMWLEEIADAANGLRRVRLVLRPTESTGRYTVVDVEPNVRKPITEEAEPGDRILVVQTLHFDASPGRAGARLKVCVLGERVIAPIDLDAVVTAKEESP